MSKQLTEKLAGGLGALALIGVMALSTAQAAPVISTSGDRSFECLSVGGNSAACSTIELVQSGLDGFELRGLGGAPLASGIDISIEIFVQALKGTSIGGWDATLVGARNASMGENVYAGVGTPGLGFLSVDANDPSDSITFLAQTDLLLRKNINALGGVVLAVRQGTAVPEPASMTMLAIGLAGIAAGLRRRRNRA